MTIAEERHHVMLRFINNQEREIQSLKEALKFYADENNWRLLTVKDDSGTVARIALGLEK